MQETAPLPRAVNHCSMAGLMCVVHRLGYSGIEAQPANVSAVAKRILMYPFSGLCGKPACTNFDDVTGR